MRSLLEHVLNGLEFLTLFKSLAVMIIHLRVELVAVNIVPLSYVTLSCCQGCQYLSWFYVARSPY